MDNCHYEHAMRTLAASLQYLLALRTPRVRKCANAHARGRHVAPTIVPTYKCTYSLSRPFSLFSYCLLVARALDPTRLVGRPAAWYRLDVRSFCEIGLGVAAGGRRCPPFDRVSMPQSALSALCGMADGRVGGQC
eukprot:6175740-Pleurochrysis_carterae.AAC.1